MKRRDFLKSTAVVPVAFTIPAFANVAPSTPAIAFIDFGDILTEVWARENKFLGTKEFWELGKYRTAWMVEIYNDFVATNPNSIVILKISEQYRWNGRFDTFVKLRLLYRAQHIVIESYEGRLSWYKNISGMALPDYNKS